MMLKRIFLILCSHSIITASLNKVASQEFSRNKNHKTKAQSFQSTGANTRSEDHRNSVETESKQHRISVHKDYPTVDDIKNILDTIDAQAITPVFFYIATSFSETSTLQTKLFDAYRFKKNQPQTSNLQIARIILQAYKKDYPLALGEDQSSLSSFTTAQIQPLAHIKKHNNPDSLGSEYLELIRNQINFNIEHRGGINQTEIAKMRFVDFQRLESVFDQDGRPIKPLDYGVVAALQRKKSSDQYETIAEILSSHHKPVTYKPQKDIYVMDEITSTDYGNGITTQDSLPTNHHVSWDRRYRPIEVMLSNMPGKKSTIYIPNSSRTIELISRNHTESSDEISTTRIQNTSTIVEEVYKRGSLSKTIITSWQNIKPEDRIAQEECQNISELAKDLGRVKKQLTWNPELEQFKFIESRDAAEDQSDFQTQTLPHPAAQLQCTAQSLTPTTSQLSANAPVFNPGRW